jgi:peptide/nickel transport system permease protein
LDLARHLVIPVFVLATSVTASLTRIMRANMLEALSQQYVITAHAKGLTRPAVVWRHALRNAVNPMITILGLQLGNILGGAALVETVLAWPGLGRLILTALLAQDLYLVVGSLIYGVILLVVGNLAADIALAVVDPRIRMA